MKIQVTQSNINRGIILDCEYCPIALSLTETGFEFVEVQDSVVFTKNWSCDLPEKAKQFVRNFDMGLSVEPFEFEIEELNEV